MDLTSDPQDLTSQEDQRILNLARSEVVMNLFLYGRVVVHRTSERLVIGNWLDDVTIRVTLSIGMQDGKLVEDSLLKETTTPAKPLDVGTTTLADEPLWQIMLIPEGSWRRKIRLIRTFVLRSVAGAQERKTELAETLERPRMK